MTQDQNNQLPVVVTPEFADSVPPEPATTQEVKELAALAVTPEKQQMLVCHRLLVGDTLVRAQKEAQDVATSMLENTQILAAYGTDVLEAVNKLNDRMLSERHPVDVPELREIMKNLSRSMRGMGKRYDPSDEKVLKKYERTKGGILSIFGFAKTFLEEFLDDIRSLQGQFDQVIEKLQGKQQLLLRNVAYYDEFYELNEQEIGKLIYKIGVMELIRDLLARKANEIVVGDSSMGDRASEEQAKLLELVTHIENKIAAFKGRLWVAWAMAPQIRNMRGISLGLSSRIDQTIGVTIPTMKSVIVVWLTLSEAEQAERFNKAVEDAYNNALTMFANAAKVSVPAMAAALATPALDPRTILAWSESLSAQADGIVAAIELGQQKRAELDQAMIEGKSVLDAATQKVNQAQLQHVLEAAREAENQAPLEISRSVPAIAAPTN